MRYVAKPGWDTPESRAWLREQFEFVVCEECRRGERAHVAVNFGLDPFALCRPTKQTNELSPMQAIVFQRLP